MLSIFLFLGIERLRKSANESFVGALTGTDLIVGAPGSSINLVLYTVFHMGEPTNNVSMDVFDRYSRDDRIEWTIPISLGDSHKGFRVVATTNKFFKHYQFRESQSLELLEGSVFSSTFDVILGAEVWKRLKYKLGDKIIVSHGLEEGFARHDNSPFVVSGILKSTGTPVDKGVYIGLEAMDLIHEGYESGNPFASFSVNSKYKNAKKKTQTSITAFLLRSKQRAALLSLQREISTNTREPLMAVFPGVALFELWKNLDYADAALKVLAAFVALVGFLSVITALYSSLEGRRREMAIFRSVGATPKKIFFLLIIETLVLTLTGIILGIAATLMGLKILSPLLQSKFGLALVHVPLSAMEFLILIAFILSGTVVGLVPAFRAYKNSLADGLRVQI